MKKKCTFNPENTTCYTCQFFKRDESDEYNYGFNTNLCMKYDKRDTRKFKHNGHCKDLPNSLGVILTLYLTFLFILKICYNTMSTTF